MKEQCDVIIAGGGIMGLLGAYQVVRAGGRVLVLEKSTIGNAQAGSSGLTRSLRSDYEDPTYSRLARLSFEKWQELERELNAELIARVGCLNVAERSAGSYAAKAAGWLKRDGRLSARLTGAAITARFPQFQNLGFATLEEEAGLGFPIRALDALRSKLADSKNCRIIENTDIQEIRLGNNRVTVRTSQGKTIAPKLVLAAGLGTPALLEKIRGSDYRLALTAARPNECIYYFPGKPELYTADKLPVFADLDKGVYAHPIVKGMAKGVKIGRYSPPSTVNKTYQANAATIAGFVEAYLPGLADARTQEVTDVDRCSYDMTADDGFVVGPVPGAPQIFVATGFCGTGYKFAPVVAELIGDFTNSSLYRYDITVFDPARPGL